MDLLTFANTYAPSIPLPRKDEKIESLYPYQNDFLISLRDHMFTHTTKSRQILGAGTMISIYIAWFLLYNKDANKTLILASPNRESGIHILEKIQIILDKALITDDCSARVNSKMQPINNKTHKALHNGNNVRLVNGPTKGMGDIHTIIVDEAAYIGDLENLLLATLTASDSLRIHLISTPNGREFFYKLKIIDNFYHKQDFHYSIAPKFANWIESCRRIIGEVAFQEEFELQFVDKKSKEEKKSVKDKTLIVRVDYELYSALTERLVQVDLSLSDYIRGLILKDLGK